MKRSFEMSVNSVVTLARAIHRVGILKVVCLTPGILCTWKGPQNKSPLCLMTDLQIPYDISKVLFG